MGPIYIIVSVIFEHVKKRKKGKKVEKNKFIAL